MPALIFAALTPGKRLHFETIRMPRRGPVLAGRGPRIVAAAMLDFPFAPEGGGNGARFLADRGQAGSCLGRFRARPPPPPRCASPLSKASRGPKKARLTGGALAAIQSVGPRRPRQGGAGHGRGAPPPQTRPPGNPETGRRPPNTVNPCSARQRGRRVEVPGKGTLAGIPSRRAFRHLKKTERSKKVEGRCGAASRPEEGGSRPTAWWGATDRAVGPALRGKKAAASAKAWRKGVNQPAKGPRPKAAHEAAKGTNSVRRCSRTPSQLYARRSRGPGSGRRQQRRSGKKKRSNRRKGRPAGAAASEVEATNPRRKRSPPDAVSRPARGRTSAFSRGGREIRARRTRLAVRTHACQATATA